LIAWLSLPWQSKGQPSGRPGLTASLPWQSRGQAGRQLGAVRPPAGDFWGRREVTKGRLEAFADAVLAIALTIMVLELRPPDGSSLTSLRPLASRFLTYVLSFVYLGIYWNNHHHLFQAVEKVNGSVLWANLHLLFWLSLVPFATAWLGEEGMRSLPVAVYGMVLILAAVAYSILVRALISLHGHQSRLAMAIGRDIKGKISVVIYATGILAAIVVPAAALGLYVLVAAIWLVPDRRFERDGT